MAKRSVFLELFSWKFQYCCIGVFAVAFLTRRSSFLFEVSCVFHMLLMNFKMLQLFFGKIFLWLLSVYNLWSSLSSCIWSVDAHQCCYYVYKIILLFFTFSFFFPLMHHLHFLKNSSESWTGVFFLPKKKGSKEAKKYMAHVVLA